MILNQKTCLDRVTRSCPLLDNEQKILLGLVSKYLYNMYVVMVVKLMAIAVNKWLKIQKTLQAFLKVLRIFYDYEYDQTRNILLTHSPWIRNKNLVTSQTWNSFAFFQTSQINTLAAKINIVQPVSWDYGWLQIDGSSWLIAVFMIFDSGRWNNKIYRNY